MIAEFTSKILFVNKCIALFLFKNYFTSFVQVMKFEFSPRFKSHRKTFWLVNYLAWLVGDGTF